MDPEKAKEEISALDLRYLVKELQFLEGSRVQKFFQNGKDLQLVLHVPGKGTNFLIAGPGKLYLTKYQLKHPAEPTAFAMYLRKHLSGKKIEKIEQHDFERIAIIHFPEHLLIVELFGTGNAIVTTKNNRIWSVMEKQFWSERKIRQMELYTFPPPRIDFDNLDEESFADMLKKSDKKIVVFLASELGIGGTYAEEICDRCKIGKNEKSKDVAADKSDAGKLFTTLSEFAKGTIEPKAQILFAESDKEKTKPIDVVPFNLAKYTNAPKTPYATFNEALDDYFTSQGDKKFREDAGKEAKVKSTKLDIRLKQQQDAIQKLSEKEKSEREKADMIYVNYENIAAALKAKMSNIEINGMKIALKVNRTAEQNAALYYENAKKMKRKIKGAEEALKKTIQEIEKNIEKNKAQSESEAQHSDRTKPIAKSAKHWYSSFRSFFTSNGLLCVAGKDATSNEVLIKKHTEPNDLVLHSEISGSPFALLKEGKTKAEKTDIEEACTFVACYSRAWKTGVGSIDAYVVNPDQVSKQAPSGEYISKGSFMIYGKKEFHKVELKIAVGFSTNEILAGPTPSISKKTKKFVVIEPGNEKSSDLSKQIKATLFEKCSKEEQEILKKVPISDIQQLIPLGVGRVAKN